MLKSVCGERVWRRLAPYKNNSLYLLVIYTLNVFFVETSTLFRVTY